jgi:hypothetical protein
MLDRLFEQIFTFKNYYKAPFASFVNVILRLIAFALAVLAFYGIGGIAPKFFSEFTVLRVIILIIAFFVAVRIFFFCADFIDSYTDGMAKKTIATKLMKSREFAEKYLRVKPDDIKLIQHYYPDIKDPNAPIPETISS